MFPTKCATLRGCIRSTGNVQGCLWPGSHSTQPSFCYILALRQRNELSQSTQKGREERSGSYTGWGPGGRMGSFFCGCTCAHPPSCHQSQLHHRDDAHTCTETHAEGEHPLGIEYRNSAGNLVLWQSRGRVSPGHCTARLAAGSPEPVGRSLSFPSPSTSRHLLPPDCSRDKNNSIYKKYRNAYN